MVLHREIVMTPGPYGRQAEAVFDLSSTQIAALSAALAHHRRTHFGGASLGTKEVLELHGLDALAEQLDQLAALGGHAPVRADADGVSALARAALVYVRERDTESYQSPEERERIAALSDLADPLIELACELRRAERQQPGATAPDDPATPGHAARFHRSPDRRHSRSRR
jgi:hypothetical protein